MRDPAGAGGATVVLASKNTAAAQVPPSVVVPPGASSASFKITTSAVSPVTSVAIVGAYGNVTRYVTLTLDDVALR